MSGQGRLFVSCSDCAGKTWSKYAVEDPSGRIRIGEGVYSVLLTRVEDSSVLDSVWRVRAKKLGEEVRSTARTSNPTATFVIGLILVVLGVVFLLRNLGITWLSWIAFGTLWPALLILVGAAFLWRWFRGGE